jgi:hypothetical protein
VTDVLDDPFDRKSARAAWWSRATAQGRWPQGIPELVSQVYHQAPAFLRANLLECLLKPVGPLALLAIAAGAFARFLYRLQRDAMPISIDDAARITSDHVLELARYLEQCSPDTLLRFAALIADRPMAWATISGSALLMTLNLRNRREQALGR